MVITLRNKALTINTVFCNLKLQLILEQETDEFNGNYAHIITSSFHV